MKATFFLLSFAALIAPVTATVVLRDTFTKGDQALLGTTADVGGTWTQTGTVATNPLQVSGNAVAMITTGQDAYCGFTATVPATGGTAIYYGVTINLSAAQTAGDYFCHLTNPLGTASNFYGRVFARASGSGYQIGLASNSGTGTVTTYGTTELSFNANYWVVVAWNFVGGSANDVFNVYVNPVSAVEGDNTPYLANYTWTGSAEPTDLAAANLRQGSASNSATLRLDNLTVATSFGQVVPEPGVFGMLALAASGLLVRGRRRCA